MAPAKFDDLHKTAKDVLSEDYATKDITFKAKSQTRLEGWSDITHAIGMGDKGTAGATLTKQIDFNFGSKCATPAKLTWKFPKPLGLNGLAFDKLEMDKAGKMKLEASMDKNFHGMPDFKIDCKSDLASMDNVTVGATYTGVANALIKAEINATNPAKYTAEVSYAVGGGATVGVKSTPADVAAVGVQYVQGPMFAAVTATDTFKTFNVHAHFKANNDLKLACNYNHGGKANGQYAAGAAYNMAPGTDLKGKFTGDAVCLSAKQKLAKGVVVTAGASVPLDTNKAWSWGMTFNIE